MALILLTFTWNVSLDIKPKAVYLRNHLNFMANEETKSVWQQDNNWVEHQISEFYVHVCDSLVCDPDQLPFPLQAKFLITKSRRLYQASKLVTLFGPL